MLNEVERQLKAAGYLRFATEITDRSGNHVYGYFPLDIYDRLLHDENFANGDFYGCHRDVGEDIRDFRSWKELFGPGALQIVMDRKTGYFYADTDKFNPYQDVVGTCGHFFGEVLPHWVKKLWK